MKTKKMALGFRSSQIKALSDKITFGKYKGQTIEKIMTGNPSYLLYLHNRKIIRLTSRLHIKAQALYDYECKLKSKAYSHLNHNYSSYYDDPYDWVDQYGYSIWD